LDIIPKLILWVILPAWIAAGLLDWACHRRAHIAEHCGPWETLFHLLLLAEAGTAVSLGLFLELNEPVLAIIALCFIAHEITAYIDINYAHPRRDISPAEQRIHDFMTAMPIAALFLIVVLHWNDVQNIATEPSRMLTEELRAKETPLPAGQVLSIFAAVILGNLVPYFEELWRGVRFLRRSRIARS
jgi:hypothetical protein